ncbi:MAG: hypothetical protein AAFO99_08725 [Bacteroidota bacterium]
MKIIYKIALLNVLFLVACGGGGDDSPEPPPPVPAPSATTLIFPEDNTECNEGQIINDTQSSVTFRWNASQNTDSYEVVIRDLNNGNITRRSVTATEAPIAILRGTPYAWSVISVANGTTETASSSESRFFNQGPGVENYAPFPALAVSPFRGETIASSTTVNLEWSGSDVDNDIISYEVFFGIDAEPITSLGSTEELTIDVSVTPGQIYFWRVITTDSAGNTSQSEIFQFRVA